MRTTLLLRSILAALALTVAVPACRGEAPEVTAESIEESGALTEQHDAATVVWTVTPDGQVRALVKTPDGKPVEKEPTGTLTVKSSDPEAASVEVRVAQDPKSKLLTATIPKLEADLTEVRYELEVDGKPVTGALHLPPGGTKEIDESAKKTAEIEITEGKTGPNGGVIQVVGDDVVEVVADEASGDVRVYVLDKDLAPVQVEDRQITVAVVSARGPETIVLVPEPGGIYFVGKMKVVAQPVKLTVAVKHRARTRVVLHGHRPGAVVVVGRGAPRVGVLVKARWSADVTVVQPSSVVVVEHHKGKGKGKAKGRGKNKGGSVNIHLH